MVNHTNDHAKARDSEPLFWLFAAAANLLLNSSCRRASVDVNGSALSDSACAAGSQARLVKSASSRPIRNVSDFLTVSNSDG